MKPAPKSTETINGKKNTEEEIYLPPIPADKIRNPVVLRALSQARKSLTPLYAVMAPLHVSILKRQER